MNASDPSAFTEAVCALAEQIKVYKSRVQELEHALKEKPTCSCSSQEVREKLERAESVEAALRFVSIRTDKLEQENVELKATLQQRESDLLKSVTVNIKEEGEPHNVHLGFQDDVTTDVKMEHSEDAMTRKDESQLVLHYKVKYKKYKAENERLQALSEDLRGELRKARDESEEATQKPHEIRFEYQEGGSEVKQLREHGEFCDYMERFPLCELRPRYEDLTPVCSVDVNLRDYLEADQRTSWCANNYMYFPEMFMWSSPNTKHHALAFGPVHVYSRLSGRWEKSPQFLPFYGHDVELFYSYDGQIYYAGTYACHDLRVVNEHGVHVDVNNETVNLQCDKIRYVTPRFMRRDLQDEGMNKSRKIHKKMCYPTVDRLYKDGVLRLEYMALQCVGFNQDLQSLLYERFDKALEPGELPTDKRKQPDDQSQENNSSKTKKIKKIAKKDKSPSHFHTDTSPLPYS